MQQFQEAETAHQQEQEAARIRKIGTKVKQEQEAQRIRDAEATRKTGEETELKRKHEEMRKLILVLIIPLLCSLIVAKLFM